MDPLIIEALDSLDFSEDLQEIPNRLPLLDDYREHHAPTDPGARSLLAIQHQLGTTVPLVRALMGDGISPDRTWFVDIPYSTHPDVRDALLDLVGNRDRCPALFTDPLVDYASAQLTRVITTLLRMLDHEHHADLLVLDDGAYFLRALSVLEAISHEAARAFNGAFMVEQTTRGHEFVKSHDDLLRRLGIRVVSIARARTKLNFEAPFIGASVAAALTSKAAALRPEGIHDIAILGYGAIGEACARELHHHLPNATITVVDDDPERLLAAKSTYPQAAVGASLAAAVGAWSTGGQGAAAPTAPHRFDLVVGCTGRNSFTLADRHLLAPTAVLASGSSAAVEFDRAGFVDLADYRDDDKITVIDRERTRACGIHADIHLRLENGDATFTNAGFPVNFNNRRECLPLVAIQPTRCLMYAAVVQVVGQPGPGRSDLNRAADDWIYDAALEQLRA